MSGGPRGVRVGMLIEMPGLGVLCEGFLECDPLDETYQFRFLDGSGEQRVVRLRDLLARYCGREVRFTIASAAALQGTLERVKPDGAAEAAVTFEDLARESQRP